MNDFNHFVLTTVHGDDTHHLVPNPAQSQEEDINVSKWVRKQ